VLRRKSKASPWILIRSGFGHYVDLAATVIAILRVEVVGNNAKLGNRINIRNQGGAILQLFFRVGAVDHKAVRVGASAIDGEGSTPPLSNLSDTEKRQVEGQADR